MHHCILVVSMFTVHKTKENKKAQLSLGKTRYGLYLSCCSRPTNFQSHLRSMIFVSSKKVYATSYQWLIVTLALFLTISEIRLLIPWNFSLKIAAKPPQLKTKNNLQNVASALCDGTIADSLRLYRLATIPHDWHTIVRYEPSRLSKVSDLHVIWKPICDFLLVINSNLGPISHRLVTIPHDRHTIVRYDLWSWPCKVIQGQWFSCHLKANMRIPINNQ